MIFQATQWRSWAPIGAFLFMACPGVESAQVAQPSASALNVHWQCSATGAVETALLSAAELGGIVNRFAGLYSTRVLGLVQSGDRVYLLGTGGFSSRVGLRADVVSAAPGRHEFVSQRHVFHVLPRAETRPGAGGFICLADPQAGRQGLVIGARGEVMLQSGRSVSFFDPSDPTVTVELRAADRAAMDLRDIGMLSGRLGIYAGLMRQRGQPDANIAVQATDGRIVFQASPGLVPTGASPGTITLAVGKEAVEGPPSGVAGKKAASVGAKAPVAAPAEPAAATPVVAEVAPAIEPVPASIPAPAAGAVAASLRPEAEPVKADASRDAIVATSLSAPAGKSGDDGSYERALRKLVERQGSASVRSISALTQVHPAVDALRAALR